MSQQQTANTQQWQINWKLETYLNESQDKPTAPTTPRTLQQNKNKNKNKKERKERKKERKKKKKKDGSRLFWGILILVPDNTTPKSRLFFQYGLQYIWI